MALNMKTLIVRRGVRVVREINGSLHTIAPKIGEPFDFTPEEVRHLQLQHPNHTRMPRNENAPIFANESSGPTDSPKEKPVQDRIPDVVTREREPVAKAASDTPGRIGAAREITEAKAPVRAASTLRTAATPPFRSAGKAAQAVDDL
jgi:hypothetical protein